MGKNNKIGRGIMVERRNNKENISDRFALKWYTFAFIAVLIILLTILWIFMIVSMRAEVNKLGTEPLELIVTDLKAQMDRVDTYLISLKVDDAAFHRLGVEAEELAVFSDLDNFKKDFSGQIEVSDNLNALMLYSQKNQKAYLGYGNMSGLSGAEVQKLKSVIRDNFSTDRIHQSEQKSWSYIETGGYALLYKTVQYEGVYCTAVFDLDVILRDSRNENDLYHLFFQKEDGQMISAGNISSDSVWLSAQMVGPLHMGIELKNGALFEYGKVYIIILIVGSVVLIGLVILIWYQMNYRNIIKNLQIEGYEKELEAKRFQLLNLQSQIQPHFYLNCLKNLYALSEKKRYEGIKSTILALSRHLRYVFSVNEIKVRLQQELSYLENYVELYRYNFFRLIILNVDVPADCLEFAIPAISLLTFMENSIKYSNVMEGALKINVSARKLVADGKPKLNLNFRDNGSGFSEEMLLTLNKGELEFTQSGHVGIYNVLYRCKILYQDEFYVAFFNDSGAVIDMYFPMNESE